MLEGFYSLVGSNVYVLEKIDCDDDDDLIIIVRGSLCWRVVLSAPVQQPLIRESGTADMLQTSKVQQWFCCQTSPKWQVDHVLVSTQCDPTRANMIKRAGNGLDFVNYSPTPLLACNLCLLECMSACTVIQPRHINSSLKEENLY